MLSLKKICRVLALPVAAVFLLTSLPQPAARAGIVPTERVLAGEQSAARQQILGFLARDDVRQQMRALGVDPAEADARVAAMTDDEVGRLVDRLPWEPAGQDGVGVVIGAVLVIFLILLITDILGLTKVFPFTRSVR